MKAFSCLFLFVIAGLHLVSAQPVRIIYDTDMALDVDDVGALAVLHHLADKHECELLAVGISTPVNIYDGYYAAACASAINTYYGRPDIPVGGYRGPYSISHAVSTYVEPVAKAFPHPLYSGLQASDAWKLYRKILAQSPDTSVVFVVVGFHTNMELLLDSKPDEYSPLNGYELVKQKVKLLSCMGGNFPDGGEEFNFNTYARSTLYVVSSWPSPVVFGGGEFGCHVECGGTLTEKYKIEDNPVAMSWYYFNGGKPRASWDELSALYAVRGCRNYFELSQPGQCFFMIKGGEWQPNRNNSQNIWIPMPTGRHRYLIPVMSYKDLGNELDEMILARPADK